YRVLGKGESTRNETCCNLNPTPTPNTNARPGGDGQPMPMVHPIVAYIPRASPVRPGEGAPEVAGCTGQDRAKSGAERRPSSRQSILMRLAARASAANRS
ncbi:hypothetical protein ACHAWF_010521, partial [Thalassiosira exigua]